MKKVIVFGLVGMMVMGMAVAAGAAASDWYVSMRASTDTLGKTGASTAVYGLTSVVDGATIAPYGAGADPTIAEVVCTDPTPADRYQVAKYAYDAATRNPAKAEVVWNLKATGSSSVGSFYVTAFNVLAGDLAGTDFTVTLYEYANGQRVNPFAFDFGTNGAYKSTTGISGTYFQKSYSATTYFQLVAAPVGEPVVTPEPGSIVAMLSGLVGLAGLGIRRRK